MPDAGMVTDMVGGWFAPKAVAAETNRLRRQTAAGRVTEYSTPTIGIIVNERLR
jgi:hypothetical protein